MLWGVHLFSGSPEESDPKRSDNPAAHSVQICSWNCLHFRWALSTEGPGTANPALDRAAAALDSAYLRCQSHQRHPRRWVSGS